MLSTSPGPRPCDVCRKPFVPARMAQRVCGYGCSRKVPILARKAEAADRRETKKKLDALKPLSHFAKLAQVEVNKYARLRDAHLGCASCDLPATWDGTWHASHLRSVGAAPGLRFHLWNLNKACNNCNLWKSGNVGEYAARLRLRIGDAKVDWLYSQNEPKKYTRDYLARLGKVFRKLNRREQIRCDAR